MQRPSEVDRIVEAALARRKRLAVFAPPAFRPTGHGSHKKRHSVNRERSHEAAARNIAADKKRKAAEARRALVVETIRAYFRGEVGDLSRIAHLLGK